VGIEIVRVAGSHVDESLVEREEEIANRNGMEKKKNRGTRLGDVGSDTTRIFRRQMNDRHANSNMTINNNSLYTARTLYSSQTATRMQPNPFVHPTDPCHKI
jgi:hypothetical protein